MNPFRARARRRIAALLSPESAYAIAYQSAGAGLELLAHAAAAGPFGNAAEALETVLDRLAAGGMTGTEIVLVVRGFDVVHENITLPPGEPAMIRQIAQREMMKRHPALGSLQVDYATHGAAAAGPREVLVGAAPVATLAALERVAVAGGASLVHVTVLPQVLQRLRDELAPGTEAVALVLAIPRAPLVAVSHELHIRYIAEPASLAVGDPARDAQMLVEQVARVRLYVRQTFRGTNVERVLVAGSGDEENRLLDVLREDLRLPAEAFGADVGNAEALLAFGAVLNHEQGGLDLLASTRRIATPLEQWTSRAAVAAVLIVAAATLWAAAGLWSTRSAGRRLERAREGVADRITAIWAMQSTIDARRAYAAQVSAMDAADARHNQVARVLEGVAAAAPSTLWLSALDLSWADNAWQVTVSGTSSGASTVDAVSALNAFHNALPTELPVGAITLDDYDYEAPDSLGTGASPVRFRLTFRAFPGS